MKVGTLDTGINPTGPTQVPRHTHTHTHEHILAVTIQSQILQEKHNLMKNFLTHQRSELRTA